MTTWQSGRAIIPHSLDRAMIHSYDKAMKKARISELKNRLSHYLRFVRRGQSVLVYDRDRPIARIDPVRDPGPLGDADQMAELERSGAVRPPTAALPTGWLDRRANVNANVVEALLEERESGR